MLELPFFIMVKNKKFYLENSSGTYEIDFEYVTITYLGNISANETINITIPIVGAYGIDESRDITVNLYLGEKKIQSEATKVNMHIPFGLDLKILEKVLNITAKNHTKIQITINNTVPAGEGSYTIHKIHVVVNGSPTEGVNVETPVYTIEQLNNSGGNLDSRNISLVLSEPELYEISVYVYAEYAEIDSENISNVGEKIVRDIIIATTKKIIIFDEGHNQYYRFASGGMQGLIQLLQEYGPVLINRGTFLLDVLTPGITGLIIIPVAEPDEEGGPVFTDEEITALQQYLEGGGSLILLGNWYQYFWPDNPNSYNELTGKYGILWIDGDCYDPVNNFGASWSVKATNFANNSIANSLTVGVEYVRFAGTALNITNASEDVNVSLYNILLGNNETFVTLGAESEEHIFEGSDVIMATMAIINDEGKLFACGSTYMFSDYYYFSENQVFIENLLYWLFGAKKLDMSVMPETQVYAGENLRLHITIQNRGTVNVTNVSLYVVVISAELQYLNDSTQFIKEKLCPGEMWNLTLIFSSREAGEYYVHLTLTAEDYEETIDKVIPLVFMEKPKGYLYLAIIVTVVIVVIVVVWLYKKEIIHFK